MYKGYLSNSLNTAILDDFLFMREMFQKFNCNLSHKTFSIKSSILESAFLILDDKVFSVPHISLTYKSIG